MKRLALLLLLVVGCDADRSCRRCAWLDDGPQCVRIEDGGVVWMVSRGSHRNDLEITWEAEPHCAECGHALMSGDKPDTECDYCGAAVACDREKRGDAISRAKTETPRPMIEMWKHPR